MTKTAWNYIVNQYKKNYYSDEAVVQAEWETFLSELFGYKKVYGEIDAHRTLTIGSSQRAIPDIIIRNNKMDLFDVELKQYNLAFTPEMENQLKSYMDLLHISVGVIVCRSIYIYLYDFHQQKLKKIEIDFTEDNADGIRFVELFSKENFNKEQIEAFIDAKLTRKTNIAKIKQAITGENLANALIKELSQQYSMDEITQAFKGVKIWVNETESMPTPSVSIVPVSKVLPSPVENLNIANVIKNVLTSLNQQQKILYNHSTSNSWIVFHTSEMDEVLPKGDPKTGSWKDGYHYHFWLGEIENNTFRAVFELGGWDLDIQANSIVQKIISSEKPSDKNRNDFQFKRIYSKKYIITGGNTEETVCVAIQELLAWQHQLLGKLK